MAGRPRWWNYAPPAATTLAAAAVMMLGGYLFRTHGWSVAGPVMTPAGFLISAAFALESRIGVSGPKPQAKASGRRFRRIVLLIAGVPMSSAHVPPVAAVTISVLTLLAGVGMAAAGYATASWNPITVPPLIFCSGLIILVAFYVGRREYA